MGLCYQILPSWSINAAFAAARGWTGEIRPQLREGAFGSGVPWSLGLAGGYSGVYFEEPERYGF